MTRDFEWYGGPVLDNVEKAKKVALTMAAVVVQGEAINRVPVDSGALKGSITYTVDGGPTMGLNTPGGKKPKSAPRSAKSDEGIKGGRKDEAIIGTNMEYAAHQEYGTSKPMAAQPYLRPALDRHRAKLIKDIGDFIGAAAEAGGKK